MISEKFILDLEVVLPSGINKRYSVIFDSDNSGGCIFQLLRPAMNLLTHLIAHAEEVPSFRISVPSGSEI